MASAKITLLCAVRPSVPAFTETCSNCTFLALRDLFRGVLSIVPDYLVLLPCVEPANRSQFLKLLHKTSIIVFTSTMIFGASVNPSLDDGPTKCSQILMFSLAVSVEGKPLDNPMDHGTRVWLVQPVQWLAMIVSKGVKECGTEYVSIFQTQVKCHINLKVFFYSIETEKNGGLVSATRMVGLYPTGGPLDDQTHTGTIHTGTIHSMYTVKISVHVRVWLAPVHPRIMVYTYVYSPTNFALGHRDYGPVRRPASRCCLCGKESPEENRLASSNITPTSTSRDPQLFASTGSLARIGNSI
ncbi:hypothetical protein C8J56DRAFT_900725 [Mycena floridula]|nr:hypothetical protein C8J56DRAFT_900725 [Mycena floridula]